jgi:tRNA nucleotidyltransferase (CCA-adding enzyme)
MVLHTQRLKKSAHKKSEKMIGMQNEIDALTKQILKKITPTNEDYAKVEALTKKLEQKITLACQEQGVKAIVRVEGSVAKDTWLSENPDIDIFMRLPTTIPRKNLGEIGLKIAKKAAVGATEQIERFAEHPYLEVIVDDYRVDIVPCYDAKPGEWQSATDRTPYHTDYINKNLSKELRGEVRLLKKFMQGVDVYGAEIKVGGFSGYLCELLILTYHSFAQTIQAFAQYNKRVVIDTENYFADREHELSLLFPEPLVIVDPVDKARNVASAVQPQKLYSFIGAARAFLKKPDAKFFYPPKPHALPTDELKRQLDGRGSSVVFLVIGGFEAVPDVLWGQLYRTKRSLHKLIELNDYKILKDSVWSNEKTLSIFAFELEQQVLPNIKKHLGPPLEREAECEQFLAKYNGNSQVVSGPYIEDCRWIVEVPRKTTDAVMLLKGKLADGGKNAGVSDLIAKAIQAKLTVLVNSEIIDVYKGNSDFAAFLTGFLSGKPFWLKAQ